MAREIIASVGRNARNLSPDVETVQQLLNGVFPHNGGPQPLLVEDGLIGPKTKDAIQRFQLHHFGWSGADGRVDPGRQTIDKLNELNRSPTKGYYFLLYQSKKSGFLKRSNRQDWFMKIDVVAIPYRPGRSQFGIFWFGPFGTAPKVPPPDSTFLNARSKHFKTTRQCTLDELVGPAVCSDVFQQSLNKPQPGGSLERKQSPAFYASLHVGMDPAEPPGPGVIVMPIGDVTIIEYRAYLSRIK